MTYYYVEDVEASLEVLQMIQTCTNYFPVPTTVNGDKLKKKFENLDKLYAIWTKYELNDSSYQSEVYKRVCGKFTIIIYRKYQK